MSNDRDARAHPWLALLFVAAGISIILMAVDVIPLDPGDVFAPRWVVASAGVVFLLAGAMAGVGTRYPRLNDGFAALLVGNMAAIASWIAFGPGEREFSAGMSMGAADVSGPQLPGVGRIVFGFSAVLLWAVTALALRRAFRRSGS